jgi:glycosyltransferase involved in cell wall biosynthesis
MALGLPVISTDVGAVSEVVVNRRTGILVPPHDGKAMARETEFLLGDTSRREAMADAARRLAVERFGVAACVGAHLSAIQVAMNHHRRLNV